MTVGSAERGTTLLLGIQGSGQLVGELPAPSLFTDVALLAESCGYDSLWAGDHVSFENPIVDVTVALATFAAVTSRVTIGAGIVLLPLRPPALVAKAFSSLDYLARGRVVLGVGVGGEGAKDFEAVGVPPSERRQRADEAMQALRTLFARSPASFEGTYTSFRDVSIEPLPAQPGGPPLWVGGRAAAALATAGRLGDGWMPIWISTGQFAAAWPEVRRHAEAAGRDPDAIVPAAVAPALVADDGDEARHLARRHLEARYGTSFSPHAIDRDCVAGTPDECRARVRAYAEAGVEHLVLNPAVGPERLLEQVERLADALVAVAR
jgi:probable F420-dependent oxidoreductase